MAHEALRMYGETVELNRYKVTYTFLGQERTAYAPTEEEAGRTAELYHGSYEPMDVSAYEWMEGLSFPTRDEAVKAFEAGQAAYEAGQREKDALVNERLRADLDETSEALNMILTGYTGEEADDETGTA